VVVIQHLIAKNQVAVVLEEIRVAVIHHHHILVMMVDQAHQVDQDLVVVKMDMIMDLLVLALVVLQVVILVELVQEVQVTLVKEVVAQVVLVKMALDLDHNKLEDLVVLVFNFHLLSVIPIKLMD